MTPGKRPLPDPDGFALLDLPFAHYLARSLSNLFMASTKAVVCLFCSCKSVAKALKRVPSSPCRLSMASILAPAPSDKLDSAAAVLLDSASDVSQALAKLSNCASKARSKDVSCSTLV